MRSPSQAFCAAASEPYFLISHLANCEPSNSSCFPLMLCSVQKSRLSSFWSWMIASAGSWASGMPVYGLGLVSSALSQAL